MTLCSIVAALRPGYSQLLVSLLGTLHSVSQWRSSLHIPQRQTDAQRQSLLFYNDEWEAAAFYSKQTRGPEQRYLVTELEALTLVEPVRHFGYYLYGKQFIAYTDHNPQCSLLVSDRLNSHLRRLGMKLQHWLVEIKYVSEEDNGLADTLSREERFLFTCNTPPMPLPEASVTIDMASSGRGMVRTQSLLTDSRILWKADSIFV